MTRRGGTGGTQAHAPDDVVVVGASLAGLLAAAALARPGRRVTVVERDVLPDDPVARRGVPQGRQPHALLYRSLVAIEELLPGFGDELQAAGAIPVDTGRLAWLGELGWSPESSQFPVLSASRPLMEHVVRGRVCRLPGVTVQGGLRVAGLRRAGDPGGRARWSVEVEGGDALAADLVVDASGRSSRLPAWLAALGVPAADVEEVDAHLGYATRVVRLPVDAVGPAGVVIAQLPGSPGGITLPVEGGRWLVTAAGAGDQRPPRDPGAWRAFVGALRDPALAEVVDAGEPEGDVVVHRQTANVRHRYDRVRAWPGGLVVVGDALCAFDPVYGQGVAVAALEALALRDAARRDDLTTARGARRFLRRAVRVGALPWAIATGEDLRLPTSDGRVPPVAALASAWTRELARLGTHGDTLAQTTLAGVYHLMASPLTVYRPALVARVLRARLRGYGPPVPRPQVLRGAATRDAVG
ncbi:FAD-binding protein [Cellulomonas sp. JZ18]|uniref:NAD(P)/FAD-dependent oxidoreductase n=1 Tax=Cellulomonas sp. JZ18 TaxID=2654191 RepID=UPI0012D40B21|nr:FAD-dependent monooxygenase [Cellulomonas sp. JZ18]QGQ18193.1 FAD-binding protein [Cellulomonas sp. JZ18]